MEEKWTETRWARLILVGFFVVILILVLGYLGGTYLVAQRPPPDLTPLHFSSATPPVAAQGDTEPPRRVKPERPTFDDLEEGEPERAPF